VVKAGFSVVPTAFVRAVLVPKGERVNGSVRHRLERAGLDVDFLVWLEGKEDRLPYTHNIPRIDPQTYALSIVAVTSLAQYFAKPDAIAPSAAQDWRDRYLVIGSFLHGALRQSFVARRKYRRQDLEVLEDTLEKLLPPNLAEPFKKDIQTLRKRHEPQPHPTALVKRRQGGKPESEQTNRMRAAIEHIRSESKRPYQDLADLWNGECGGDYHPDELAGRLRKGPKDEIDQGSGQLALWREIYSGSFTAVFPAPFPLHPLLVRPMTGGKGPREG
jgi:hypothetical protein